MVTLDILVPEFHRTPAYYRFNLDRPAIPHRSHQLHFWIGTLAYQDLFLATPAALLGRQLDEPQTFEFDQGLGTRIHLVMSRRGHPVEMFTDGLK